MSEQELAKSVRENVERYKNGMRANFRYEGIGYTVWGDSLEELQRKARQVVQMVSEGVYA